MAEPASKEYIPNPYTPNLSGLTIGKPVAFGGVGLFLSYTISTLHEFGLPITLAQQEALETWFNQAEIFLLPMITYFLMKKHFHDTAVDLLHQPTPAPPVIATAPVATEPPLPPLH